jgi:hypothetical protein
VTLTLHRYKNSEFFLYEPRDTPVALTNLVYLSCPRCCVRNTLFHSMKTEPPINDIILWHIRAGVAQSENCLTADWTTGVRPRTEAENFSSSLCVQTGSGAHPASCTMCTGGPFPGGKCGRGVKLTTHPHLVPRLRMSRSYTSSPPRRLHGVLPDTFTFYLWPTGVSCGTEIDSQYTHRWLLWQPTCWRISTVMTVWIFNVRRTFILLQSSIDIKMFAYFRP